MMLSSSTATALVARAAEIQQAHAGVVDAARTAVERAISAGNALLEAKRLVGHGGWLPWLGANARLSARQAQRYMQVAKMVADGKYVPRDAFDLKKVLAAPAPERRKPTAARVASEPAAARRKGMPADMRSALEALETDPDLHREFVTTAAGRLKADPDAHRAILRVLLDLKSPYEVGDLLFKVFSHRPWLAQDVGNRLLDRVRWAAQRDEDDAEATMGPEVAR
jgi:hypothetical protein